jgi:septal ring factor EnvC (AmiA/AmiB activator)
MLTCLTLLPSQANNDFTFGSAVRFNTSSEESRAELRQKKKELSDKRNEVSKELRALSKEIYLEKLELKKLERRGDDSSSQKAKLKSMESRKEELYGLKEKYEYRYEKKTFDYGGFGYPYFFMFRP